MDFVDTNEADYVRVASVGGLASDDIRLFRSCDDDLGFGDLLFGQLTITSQLRNRDSKRFEALTEIADLFLDQSLERSDVNYFEFIESDLACLCVAVLSNLTKHGKHCNVGLAGAGRCTYQHVSIVFEGHGIALGLDAIQLLRRAEAYPSPVRKFG